MCVLASGYVEMNYLMLQILFCFYLFLLKLDTCSFSAAALTFVLLESRLEERIFFCTSRKELLQTSVTPLQILHQIFLLFSLYVFGGREVCSCDYKYKFNSTCSVNL